MYLSFIRQILMRFAASFPSVGWLHSLTRFDRVPSKNCPVPYARPHSGVDCDSSPRDWSRPVQSLPPVRVPAPLARPCPDDRREQQQQQQHRERREENRLLLTNQPTTPISKKKKAFGTGGGGGGGGDATHV